MTDEPLLLRVPEVARYLAISRSKAYVLVQTGVIPSLRIGNSVRVPRAALDAWIADHTLGGNNPDALGLAQGKSRWGGPAV